MYDGELLKERFDTIKIRQLESQIAALKAELAQQANNKQSTPLCPKCKSELITIHCRSCNSDLIQG